MTFSDILSKIDDILYTWCLIYMLAGAGIFFTIRTGFVQIRLIKDCFKYMFEKKSSKNGMSSFQALMIATASRVGTGNMAGVATAIVMGGPGAAFWMWLMAVLGAASAFVESTLAQIYKTGDGKGGYKGGPAYYIERALHSRLLGIVFAVSLIATFAFGFNGLQAYNIVSTMEYYVPDLYNSPVPLVIGCILFMASLYIFLAGSEKIGWLSSVLVPIMSVLYIVMGILVIIMNITEIPAVFSAIIKSAFDFKAIFGGFTGSCMVYGIKRGLFSNEAGMGSAPNASASAEVSHPVKQGLAQVISVYIDTLLICSTTVFILLLTGVYKTDSTLNGIPLLQQSLAHQFGNGAIHIITVAVCMFAFTSIVGNYYYAEANILFISKKKGVLTVFRIAAAVMVMMGAMNSMDTAWCLADITMGLEAIINIIAILLLSRIAFDALKDYERQKANGIDPVFHAHDIGLKNTDLWK
ncbi:MAG: alanine:cation symporter family protein [Lachnospiraceae bacterium]|nr:alanine:cation symporter family protein [Lachnospiraceae bacterium]